MSPTPTLLPPSTPPAPTAPAIPARPALAGRALAMSPLAVLALGACTTVGPDYTPPQPRMPEGWSSPLAPGVAPDASPAALAAWWTTLDDPTLTDLIQRAIENNKDLAVARARIREARALAIIAGAADEPQLDAAARASRDLRSVNTNQGNFGDRESTLFQAGFDATWELDVFGGTRRGVEAALADTDAAVENLHAVRVSLAAEVAQAYTRLRGFERRIAIATKNIRTQQNTVELADARFKAGLRSDLDVAQAQTQLALTTSQVPTHEIGLRQALHRLSVLVAEPPSALVGLLSAANSPAGIPAPNPSGQTIPIGLPSDLLRQRPDVRRAERDLAASNARIGVATADLFPRFNLTGSLGLQSQHPDDFPEGRSAYWSIAPGVRWPILSGGRIRANIEASNARQEAAAAGYERAVLEAIEDAENALVSFDREQARATALRQAVSASQRAFDLSDELYRRGLTDFLSVLDAQRSLFSAEEQLVVSEETVTQNLIALYKALGGGWQGFDPQPEPPTPDTAPSAPPAQADPPPVQDQEIR